MQLTAQRGGHRKKGYGRGGACSVAYRLGGQRGGSEKEDDNYYEYSK